MVEFLIQHMTTCKTMPCIISNLNTIEFLNQHMYMTKRKAVSYVISSLNSSYNDTNYIQFIKIIAIN